MHVFMYMYLSLSSSEHHELAKLLQDTNDHTSSDGRNTRDHIQSELSTVIESLEGKGEQIEIVKRLLRERKRPRSSSRGRGVGVVSHVGGTDDNLQVLQKMKRLQCTLQRDDLSWN